jgi:hypothetical protein
VVQRYGRHEETRTPDLYRVKRVSSISTVCDVWLFFLALNSFGRALRGETPSYLQSAQMP